LWTQEQGLAGKLTLLDDVREVMGATLRSLGYSYNATDPKQIEAAYQKLRDLKPAIASFQTYGWEDQLVSGDLAMSMAYSPLGNKLPAEQTQLKYVIPKSGTSLWTDAIAIPAGAPNLDAAYEWISFMMQPENAVLGVKELRLATPLQTAFDLLPDDLKNNKNQFPPDDFLDKCEGIKPLPDDVLKIYDRYWTELKSA
jgi:spermidine/putrescine transport system substrate-binding protein